MSLSVTEQSFQYIGILNGVMYRIDPLTGRSIEPVYSSQPVRAWSDLARDEPAAFAIPAPAPARMEPELPAEETAAQAVEHVAAPPSNLFPRSGAEPLRAGHPDLWALIVAGTCLEGSEYSAS